MKVTLPTGYLFTTQGSKGQLETLSIGDYGKRANVKANFLGYHRDICGVENQPTMPLSEKWVITVSTQYGCAMKCNFCDVPDVPFKGNASFDDLKSQFYAALGCFPEVKYTDRLNLHFARMGEPILNESVFTFTEWLALNKRKIQKETGVRIEVLHPVLTTSAPRFRGLHENLQYWCSLKNRLYQGQAGLQLSVNSTSEEQRSKMFGGKAVTLQELSRLGELLPEPLGRKYCLNFAYSTDFEVDARLLRSLFDTEKFMCKITPIHNNTACRENGIQTVGGYDSYVPYRKPEQELLEQGFDVLVFVPSLDEEDGLVTCGNLVLSGTEVRVDPKLNVGEPT